MADGRTILTFSTAFEQSGLTQVELARQLEATEGQVSRWLRGVHVPTRHRRRQIVKALGRRGVACTAEELWP